MAGKKGNSFRNSADDFQAEEKEVKKPLKGNKFAWIKDERTRRITGAFFILFSLFLFLAFTSHIINLWGFETDQDLFNWQNNYFTIKFGPSRVINCLRFRNTYKFSNF
jgi:hypothetical protein